MTVMFCSVMTCNHNHLDDIQRLSMKCTTRRSTTPRLPVAKLSHESWKDSIIAQAYIEWLQLSSIDLKQRMRFTLRFARGQRAKFGECAEPI